MLSTTHVVELESEGRLTGTVSSKGTSSSAGGERTLVVLLRMVDPAA